MRPTPFRTLLLALSLALGATTMTAHAQTLASVGALSDGTLLNVSAQAEARRLAAGPGVTLLCGRFEGVDERVLAARAIEEVSLGDFILTGGEIAAMALIDACVRLIPRVLGNADSSVEESFSNGLLEYPHYTRPDVFESLSVPDVLRSGDHARIDAGSDLRICSSSALSEMRTGASAAR